MNIVLIAIPQRGNSTWKKREAKIKKKTNNVLYNEICSQLKR